MLYLRSIGYVWIGSGFEGKTWWDILELLIIPIILAVIAIVVEIIERKTDRELNIDNQRERLIQNYFDFVSKLILENDHKNSEPNDEVREIARIKTLTILTNIDKKKQKFKN